MGKLEVFTAYFDELRGKEGYRGFTEEQILKVLDSLQIEKHEKVGKIPLDTVNSIFSQLTGTDQSIDGKELLEFLETSMLFGKTDMNIMTKLFRYLTRKDTSGRNALFVIDVQNDFISGALALKNAPAGQDGGQVVPLINPLVEHFPVVVYTGDWHPKDHVSFFTNVDKHQLHESSKITVENAQPFKKCVFKDEHVEEMEQILWPEHCVPNTWGAEFHADLKIKDGSIIIHKGTNSNYDSYSGFWDNYKCSQTELFAKLLDDDVTSVYVCGLAMEYCVASTAFDALEHGFTCAVIEDATPGFSCDGIVETKNKLTTQGVALVQLAEFYAKEK